jgi:hypothetical protein
MEYGRPLKAAPADQGRRDKTMGIALHLYFKEPQK